jgi:signal transduction histidine kinase
MWKNIAAPAVLVVFFWGISIFASTWYIHWLEQAEAKMISEDLSTIRAANDMRYDIRRMQRTTAESQRPAPAPVVAEIDALEHEFDRHYEAAVESSFSQEEKLLDREIIARFERYQKEVRRQLREPASTQGQQFADVQSRAHLADDLTDSARRLGEVNERNMQARAAPQPGLNASFIAIRYSLLIMGPIAGIICGAWISRRFNRSISRISITLNDAGLEMPANVGGVDVREAGDLSRLGKQVDLVVARIRQVNQELHQTRQRALSAARLAAVGEMAAGVAHELRNPLTSVKLLIQTAAQRRDRAMTDKQFNVVLEEVMRMETTIEQLLDFARPSVMKKSRCDLRGIISRALTLIEGRAQHAGVTVAFDSPVAPVMIDTDAEQLRQVFHNLLQNGIEAMASGGTLTVAMKTGASADDICTVSISDTGPGISESIIGRLFDPFTTDKARGTGLGLAISLRIVEDHGGTLTAANRAEGGAVFTVELPQSVVASLPDGSDLVAGGIAFAACRLARTEADPPVRQAASGEGSSTEMRARFRAQ